MSTNPLALPLGKAPQAPNGFALKFFGVDVTDAPNCVWLALQGRHVEDQDVSPCVAWSMQAAIKAKSPLFLEEVIGKLGRDSLDLSGLPMSSPEFPGADGNGVSALQMLADVLVCKPVKHLSLTGCGLSDKHCGALTTLMGANSLLESLELSSNTGLGGAGCAVIGEALRANVQLKTLMLTSCGLGAGDFLHVMQAICPMASDPADTSGASAFLNTHLHTLRLDHNPKMLEGPAWDCIGSILLLRAPRYLEVLGLADTGLAIHHPLVKHLLLQGESLADFENVMHHQILEQVYGDLTRMRGNTNAMAANAAGIDPRYTAEIEGECEQNDHRSDDAVGRVQRAKEQAGARWNDIRIVSGIRILDLSGNRWQTDASLYFIQELFDCSAPHQCVVLSDLVGPERPYPGELRTLSQFARDFQLRAQQPGPCYSQRLHTIDL